MKQRSSTTTGRETPTTPAIDRRQSDRQLFTATADLLELDTHSRAKVRVSDLSKGGCYVDMVTPFPVGTPVRLGIQNGNKVFEAQGTVSYSLEHMGMGITFTEISEQATGVLDEWLGTRPAEAALASVLAGTNWRPETSPAKRAQKDVLGRLIQHLMRLRVLTTEQGQDLLQDLSEE